MKFCICLIATVFALIGANAIAAPGDEPERDWNSFDCAAPKTHNEADLCEQRKMAKAAERTVDTGYIQLALSALGFAAVLWSLYYVRISTKASAEAATAATLSTQMASKTAERQLRAYLHASLPTIKDFGPDKRPRAEVHITNAGQTPAHDVVCHGYISIRQRGNSSWEIPETDRFRSQNTFGPGSSDIFEARMRNAIAREEFEAWEAGLSECWFFGQVKYLDVFDKRQTTTFRYVLMRSDAGPEWITAAEGNTAT